MYTKVYSAQRTYGDNKLNIKKNVQTWLTRALDDPITKTLSKNSHLTKIQLETLLIDVLSDTVAGIPLKYDAKARLRLTKAQISRGSFNRTLEQAKNNVVKAIYTVLLLGYLGVFESTTLDPYLEIANKLNRYMEAYRTMPNQGGQLKEQLAVMKMMREQLQTALKQLSSP